MFEYSQRITHVSYVSLIHDLYTVVGSLGTIAITIDSHDTVMLAERSHIACVRRYRTLSDYKLYVLHAVGIRGIPLHSLRAGIHITKLHVR